MPIGKHAYNLIESLVSEGLTGSQSRVVQQMDAGTRAPFISQYRGIKDDTARKTFANNKLSGNFEGNSEFAGKMRQMGVSKDTPMQEVDLRARLDSDMKRPYDQRTMPGTMNVPSNMRGLGINQNTTIGEISNNQQLATRVALEDFSYAAVKGEMNGAEALAGGRKLGLTQKNDTKSMTYSTTAESTKEINNMHAINPDSGVPFAMEGNRAKIPSSVEHFDPTKVRTRTDQKMTADTSSVPNPSLGGRQDVNVSTGKRTVSQEEFNRNNTINYINDELIPQTMANTADMIGNYSGLNRAIDKVDSTMKAGAQDLAKSASYLADAAGKHMAGAVAGAGAVTMSEGEVTASGLARGAMAGIGGGIVGRMAAGSLQGGALNQMGRQFGGALGGVTREGRVGGASRKAGDFISNSMESLSAGASQSTNAARVATFGGAALAGFSMGRDNSHSRGLNSGRGSRF